MTTVAEETRNKYWEELSEVASALASNCSKLLRHKGKVYGNVIDGGHLRSLEYTITVTPELSDRDDATRLEPIDPYLAQNLLVNLAAEFPEFAQIKDWREMTRNNITPELIEKLFMVAHRRTFVGVCGIHQSWEKGELATTPTKETIRTPSLIDEYLLYKADGGAADGYLTVRERKLRFFARQYPQLPADPKALRTYLRQFKTGDVPTRQDQWKALSDLYKFAADECGIHNPMLEVDKPRFKKKPGQRLSLDQAKTYLTGIQTDLEWAIITCYFGLRFRGIEAALQQRDDVKSDYIIVTHGKERGEELPLHPVFQHMLSRLKNDHELLFGLSSSTLAYHVKQVGKRVGITVSPRRLRNTAAALWYTYGGDKASNRLLLRHGTDDMTDHYSNIFLDELRVKEHRHSPMLNLIRELGLAPAMPDYPNTSSAQQP